jgi:hypothetical protein
METTTVDANLVDTFERYRDASEVAQYLGRLEGAQELEIVGRAFRSVRRAGRESSRAAAIAGAVWRGALIGLAVAIALAVSGWLESTRTFAEAAAAGAVIGSLAGGALRLVARRGRSAVADVAEPDRFDVVASTPEEAGRARRRLVRLRQGARSHAV